MIRNTLAYLINPLVPEGQSTSRTFSCGYAISQQKYYAAPVFKVLFCLYLSYFVKEILLKLFKYTGVSLHFIKRKKNFGFFYVHDKTKKANEYYVLYGVSCQGA